MKGSGAALTVLAYLVLCAGAIAGSVTDDARRAEDLQAAGDTSGAEAAMRDAYGSLWQDGPLFIRKAVLVDEPATGFGAYTEAADNAFQSGEPIRLYLEPAGYGFTEAGGGFGISFQVDAEIRTVDRTVIWGRQDIHRFGSDRSTRVFEYFETLAFDLEGLPKGDYVIGTTLTDLASGKSATVDTPIRIE